MLLSLAATVAAAEPWKPILRDESTSIYRWQSTCNSYVVVRNNQALVVDPGDGTVLNKLAEIGIERATMILLTSHHRERLQGIVTADLAGTVVAGPQAERPLLEDPTSFRKWYPTLGDKFSVYGASYVRPSRLPITLGQGLTDGETFTWQDLKITCLETPGNSPGGMTYLLEVDGKLAGLSGGVIYDGAKMVNWFDTEWDYGFAKGLDTLIESVSGLIDQRPAVLLPAYGRVIKDAPEQLSLYHEKLKQFREKYVRGYPVFGMTNKQRDPISTPTKVSGLHQVTPHLFKLGESEKGWNFAIIISDEGHGLILDAGLLPATKLEELIVGMRQHLGLKKIDAFWISHMHGDHFLQGPLLREKYGAESWTLDRIVDKIENPRRYDYAALVSAYGNGVDGMPIDKAFADGESIVWQGYKVQVDWMPGQTEFGCSLWLNIDGNRIVFTGDNLFGDPSDPAQDGHEAVVARNSCVFEEGYLQGSQYLLDLQPDIVMGSHSYVMPNPRAFLQRYHRWAEEIIELYKELLPGDHYEYRFDPYWVSAYPYRVDLTAENRQTVKITVRNYRDRPEQHRVTFQPPPGVHVEPAVLEGTVAAKSRETFEVVITSNPAATTSDIGIVAMDITLDADLNGDRYGEWFDFLVRTKRTNESDSAGP